MSGITAGTLALYASLAAAAVGAAATGVELSNEPSAPKAPTVIGAQSQQAQAQQAAALAQAQALKQRRGQASTELTSPLGTTGSPQTQTATLGT